MLAYTYPLLNIFWTMLWFFAFFIWIWLLSSSSPTSSGATTWAASPRRCG